MLTCSIQVRASTSGKTSLLQLQCGQWPKRHGSRWGDARAEAVMGQEAEMGAARSEDRRGWGFPLGQESLGQVSGSLSLEGIVACRHPEFCPPSLRRCLPPVPLPFFSKPLLKEVGSVVATGLSSTWGRALQPHLGTRAASALVSNGWRTRFRSLLGQPGDCEIQSYRDQREREAESPEQGCREQGGPTMAMSFFASLLPSHEHSSPTDKDFRVLEQKGHLQPLSTISRGFGAKGCVPG